MAPISRSVFGNGPLGPSLAPWIRQRPWLQKYWAKWSDFYKNAAGYRQKGYVYDDLIPEENSVVQKAISRLTPQQSFDRVYRLRRGLIQSMLHKPLPKDQWTRHETDERYLTPLIEQVLAENKEREEWDNAIVERIKQRKEGKSNIFDKPHH